MKKDWWDSAMIKHDFRLIMNKSKIESGILKNLCVTIELKSVD